MTLDRTIGCACGTLLGWIWSFSTIAQTLGFPVDGSSLTTQDSMRQTACKPCQLWTASVAGGTLGATYLALDKVWYTQYDRSPLHSFDDSGEWLQMDKAGHLFSAYTLGRWGYTGWRNCGSPETGSILFGGGLGLLFLTGVELLDGTSTGWGFSWSDMAANGLGSGLFMGQQAGWGEQRIVVKLSAHPTAFAEQRPSLLGSSLGERVLKDYNGQTIWLSANLWSFQKDSGIPKWLNVAAGYGMEGLVSAFPNDADPQYAGSVYRQYFLAPDIDLTRIPVRSKAWRTVLLVLNSIKIPSPAVEFRSTGRVLVHGLYF